MFQSYSHIVGIPTELPEVVAIEMPL